MQKIRGVLKISGGATTWSDRWGDIAASPEIIVGVKAFRTCGCTTSGAVAGDHCRSQRGART